MSNLFKNLWFKNLKDNDMYINDTAVRIRAGFLLAVPLFMGLTLFDVVYSSKWIVDSGTIVDTYDTNFDDQIIYSAEISRRTFEYSMQTYILFYVLFEMLAGMFVFTSRLSPTILISSYLAKDKPSVWKPLAPKRFAWSIGASIISFCLVFFNPALVASWVNGLFGSELLPAHTNFLPANIVIILIWVCIGFMWMETVLGFCVGCKVHSILVWLKIVKEPCLACDNLSWTLDEDNNSKSKK